MVPHMHSIDLAENFMDLIPKSMWTIRYEMRSQLPEALSLMQFRVLMQVDKGISSPTKLAEMIGVSTSALSRSLDQLEQKQMLTRALPIQKKSKNCIQKCDRRQVVVALTKQGLRCIQKARATSKDRFQKKFSKLSMIEKSELMQGFQILEKVISS